jgi:adenine-specific DNA-methyltransferase
MITEQLNITPLKPRKALNKAFLKVKPLRSDIEKFKANLIQLLDRINDAESEEFHKNLVIDFLKKTYYEPNHFINTKGRNDLVIHNGNKAEYDYGLLVAPNIFKEDKALYGNKDVQKKDKERAEKILAEINKLKTEIEEIKNNKIYENAFEWRFEFPEVLDDNGNFMGFDVVIGNPPYMRIQSLNDYVEIYKSFYQSANTGNYDIYVLFIEKCTELLNNHGILQFILPHKFLIADFGKGVREFLYKSQIASEIIHFGHEMIFEEATTYTCLLTLNKREKLNLKFAEILSSNLATNIEFTVIKYENIPKNNPWIFKSNASSTIIERFYNMPLRVGDVLDKVFSGIQTSADKIYSIIGLENNGLVVGKSKNGDENIKIERGLLKPLIKGDDIKRYSPIITDVFVIFPYVLKSGKAIPMNEEFIKVNFPLGYTYLKSYEKELRAREKGKMNLDNKWFLYNYPKNLYSSNQEKLVSPDITFGMNITKEYGNYCVKNGAYGITIRPKYEKFKNEIIGILNSKLLWFYLQNTGNVLRGGYFRFNTKYIVPFPIPDFSQNTTFDLSKYVEKAFEAKENGKKSIDYESKIDQLVYELYGLTEDEIKIVEGKNAI